MAAPVSVFVDGTKVKVRNSQVNIDDRIGERSVANFTIVDTPGTANYSRGQPVSIYNDDRATATGTPIFAGFISIPEGQVLTTSGALLHSISCMDNHYLADKRIASKVWENKSSASMVTELHTDYLAAEGITIGEIQTGDTFTRVVANYVPVTDIIDTIAEANGFVWYIDADKKLYFIDRTTNTASFDLTASNVLETTSPRYSKGNQQYRNVQWIRGGTDTVTQMENFLGDGTQNTFTVGFPINAEPEITEDSVSQVVGIKGLESGMDYYWNKGDPTILAETAPSNNAAIQVQYAGQYKTIMMVRDDTAVASQLAIEGSGTGQVENAIVNSDLGSRVEAQEFGEAKLTQWCQDAEKFQFTTRTSGLKAGQLLNVTFSPFSFASHDMLIESVNTIANDVELNYNISAITGPMIGSWARLFKSFSDQRAVKLGADEKVILMRIEKEVLSLTETATVYTDSISSGIVGRWLNSAPINRGSLDHVQHDLMDFSEAISGDVYATEYYTYG